MGGSSSKSSMIIDTKNLNKQTSDFLTKNQTTQSQSGVVVQSQDLAKAQFLSCTADIAQTGEITMKAIQSFDNDSTLALQTMMQSAVKNDLQKQADQSSGWGSTSIAEKKADEMKVKTEIQNIIETNVTTENLNEQIQQITTVQEQDASKTVFDPCGYSQIAAAGFAINQDIINACKECDNETFNKDGSVKSRSGCKLPVCKIDQNVLVSMVAEQMGKNVSSAVQENKVINDVVNKAKMKSDQSTQGVGGALGEMLAGLTGPMKIIAAVICIGLCAALIFMMSPAGQNATRAAAAKI